MKLVPYCCLECGRFLERSEAVFTDGEAQCADGCERAPARKLPEHRDIYSRPTWSPKDD